MQMAQNMGQKANMMTLDSFLLSDDDEYLISELSRAQAVKDRDLEKSEKTWRPTLLQMCRQKGFDLDDLDLPEELEDADGLRGLCERQRTAKLKGKVGICH